MHRVPLWYWYVCLGKLPNETMCQVFYESDDLSLLFVCIVILCFILFTCMCHPTNKISMLINTLNLFRFIYVFNLVFKHFKFIYTLLYFHFGTYADIFNVRKIWWTFLTGKKVVGLYDNEKMTFSWKDQCSILSTPVPPTFAEPVLKYRRLEARTKKNWPLFGENQWWKWRCKML